jgi:hypothetical protein
MGLFVGRGRAVGLFGLVTPSVWGLTSFWFGPVNALASGLAAGGIAAFVLLPGWYGMESRSGWGEVDDD